MDFQRQLAFLFFIFLSTPLLAASGASAAAAPRPDAEADPVRAALISEFSSFQPGQTLTVALRLDHGKGWHTYWKDPGDAGLPTTLTWNLDENATASEILWPKPQRFDDPGGLVGYGYTGIAHLLVEIRIPASYQAAVLKLKAKAEYLMCREICIPGSAELKLDLPRSDAPQRSAEAPAIAAARKTLGQAPPGYKAALSPDKQKKKSLPRARTDSAVAQGSDTAASIPHQVKLPALAKSRLGGMAWILLLALLGGVILNLMPCVLPVLALKVLAFVGQAGQSRAEALRISGAYASGILASFWVLAGLVAALKGVGAAVGWGFQFQSTGFVAFMAALVLGVALNLFGVFEVTLPGALADRAAQAGVREGLKGSFFQGAFMTLLSTPCTAPFLGTALGFAFGQSVAVLFLVFTFVGLGLALPYVLLSLVPSARAWLPKPGLWMLRLKQFMGFPMLATLAWLLWVLERQVGAAGQLWLMVWLVVLALGLWAYGIRRDAWMLVALFLVLIGGGSWLRRGPLATAVPSERSAAKQGWIAYDAAELKKLLEEGRTVFVDATADWCWTCKLNEKAVLESEGVERAFAEKSIVKMRADWTRRDMAVTALIRSFGRSGVPLYAFYPPKGDPRLLPELLTPQILISAIPR